ncbi:hypothetical protein L3Q82_012875, partial [Scortum barcoo]
MSICHLQLDGLVRRFHAVSLQKNWIEAQHYCREKFIDLATIHHQTNNTEAQQAAGDGTFWIGLSYDRSWRWSEDREGSTEVSFTNWAANPTQSAGCVSISGLGLWSAEDCATMHHVLCYSANSNKHVLVRQLMSWTDAQTHCRSTYTELSSIRTTETNTYISGLLQNASTFTGGIGRKRRDTSGSLLHAWIGLHRYSWVWSDRSSASYLQWGSKQPEKDRDCVMMDSKDSSADWYSRHCDETRSFLCYKAVRPLSLRSVKVRLSGASADLNDPTLQDNILQQVNHRLFCWLEEKLEDGGLREEVKLRWRRQPDGKVFHREEEERAPPADREKE